MPLFISKDTDAPKGSVGPIASIAAASAKELMSTLETAIGAKTSFSWTTDDEAELVNFATMHLQGSPIFITDSRVVDKTSTTSHVSVALLLDNAADVESAMLDEGSLSISKVTKHDCGTTYGIVQDPFGITWTLTHRGEETSVKPVRRRFVPIVLSSGGLDHIDFLKKTMGATHSNQPDLTKAGDVAFCELTIAGDSLFFSSTVADDASGGEMLDDDGKPKSMVFVAIMADPGQGESIAAVMAKGGSIVQPVAKQSCGSISGRMRDAQGLLWTVFE